MVKGLIFDVDGTLVDSMPDFCEMIQLFLSDLGLPSVSEREIKKAIGKGARNTMLKVLSLLNYDISGKEEQLFSDFMFIYNSKPLDKSHLWPNVKTTLELLKLQGYKMSLCTNKPHLPVVHVTERLGIINYFSQITDAETKPYMKPDKRIVEFTADKMGIPLTDCIFIGDSSVDITAAKNAGIPSVLVSYGYEPGDITSLKADYIIDDFAELTEVLNKLSQKR